MRRRSVKGHPVLSLRSRREEELFFTLASPPCLSWRAVLRGEVLRRRFLCVVYYEWRQAGGVQVGQPPARLPRGPIVISIALRCLSLVSRMEHPPLLSERVMHG